MEQNNQSNIDELLNLLFPDIFENIEDLEKKYKARSLKKDAEVTRFAPSPTGFLHTGSLFTSLISFLVAKKTDGVFYIRLEDTDTKRKISGSEEAFLEELKTFNIIADEGFGFGGDYGPYKQSEREKIYKIVIKELFKNDLAYVCFCTNEELEEIREIQKASKQNTGYYGNYAKCRFLKIDEVIKRIKNGEKYVIRFKSHGDHTKKVVLYDEIREYLSISENDIDIIILKNDGLPTYHFAHVVDDHFMHTTIITRGEEWISSFPIHVQLFNSLKWKLPKYAHLPSISKVENNKKRKLSKRLDPEAKVSFFLNEGYPVESVLSYLMNIANSSFEPWVLKNKFKNIFSFDFSIKKINLDNALFDLKKLNFFSREFLSTISAEEIATRALKYAEKYEEKLEKLIKKDFSYFVKIMNIERNQENPRKDFAKYSDIYPQIICFYNDEFEKKILNNIKFDEKINKEKICDILNDFINDKNFLFSEEIWFKSMKKIAEKYNFAINYAEYKKNPNLFCGNIGDFINIFRISITGKKTSPSLYCILNILGAETVEKRLKKVVDFLKNSSN